MPVCTERKATGEYVLACFMFATMSQSADNTITDEIYELGSEFLKSARP